MNPEIAALAGLQYKYNRNNGPLTPLEIVKSEEGNCASGCFIKGDLNFI